jgi:hypothetical protein
LANVVLWFLRLINPSSYVWDTSAKKQRQHADGPKLTTIESLLRFGLPIPLETRLPLHVFALPCSDTDFNKRRSCQSMSNPHTKFRARIGNAQ